MRYLPTVVPIIDGKSWSGPKLASLEVTVHVVKHASAQQAEFMPGLTASTFPDWVRFD
jgi:hypothetical protein